MLQPDKILIVDDEIGYINLLKEELEETSRYEVDLSYDGAEAINSLQKKIYDIVLLDIGLPRISGLEVLKFLQENYPETQVIILSRFSDAKTIVQTIKLGAYEFIGKPYEIDELLYVIERALERKRLSIKNKLMETELSKVVGSEIIGLAPSFQSVIDSAKKVADSDSFILIEGASGTGKELLANLIHNNSSRKKNPFVAVNCAAIPDTLLESELFGYEKGAFTNAYTAKEGLVEVANGGTLFLDEVSDISINIQPKLLRFLETGNFRRVGGTNEIHVDIRVISATNKNLLEETKQGRFREDLYFRLNVFNLKMPLLKERKEDIPLLVNFFLKKKAKAKEPKVIHPEALEVLMQYDWPGNVRELEHVIEGAIILSNDNTIYPHDLKIHTKKIIINEETKIAESKNLHLPNQSMFMSMEEIEKQYIMKVLKTMNGNRKKTAEILKISTKSLYLKIKRYGIKIDD